MPRWNTYYMADAWGFGMTMEARYESVDETTNKKVPVGIVLSIMLFTRMFEVAFYWGESPWS